jgi:CRP/FNR family cyclic AMP-dependent transcriptional regulator
MTPVAAAKKRRRFNLQTFLSTIDGGRKKLSLPKKQMVFSQGDLADSVFYIQKGKVKLSVVAKGGKEASIGILNEGDFFGEACLAGQPLRMCSATAMTDCTLMRIDKKSMMEVLHREHAFSDMFVAYLLTRNIRYEEDLVDQLFNSSQKRLARILLLLAHFGKDGKARSCDFPKSVWRVWQRWWAVRQFGRPLAGNRSIESLTGVGKLGRIVFLFYRGKQGLSLENQFGRCLMF